MVLNLDECKESECKQMRAHKMQCNVIKCWSAQMLVNASCRMLPECIRCADLATDGFANVLECGRIVCGGSNAVGMHKNEVNEFK